MSVNEEPSGCEIRKVGAGSRSFFLTSHSFTKGEKIGKGIDLALSSAGGSVKKNFWIMVKASYIKACPAMTWGH